ncbi:FadR/GntR family transcriptional regulator [Metabacillus iocasae]|uniref:GntR family transcriptional repressor for pyruvate dehydrogenase complex n=1 Tax=Priestia iocasae TaxID=2291674 RepID=A0ABS2QUY5_9BACI|nr:FadR/GntR family transcriptional regulator [Metabacillus iocasae]MBM7703008.1 GntR family transcriptional repressor for pyruvate dehydrogenase complex [Metabacillus iocasae]
MFTPIERKKVSSQVLDQLKEMIKDKTFPPESKLPSEHELSKMFGVSRAPIREALSVLAASGLIESRQGGGSYVKRVELAGMLDPVTFEMVEMDQIYDLLEMRSIVESEAAKLAAERRNEEDLDLIREAINSFKQTIDNYSTVGHEADFQFHYAVVKAASNPFLMQAFENLAELNRKALLFSLKKNVQKEKREKVYKEHVRIYEAILDQDAERASKSMRIHLTNARIKLGDERVAIGENE